MKSVDDDGRIYIEGAVCPYCRENHAWDRGDPRMLVCPRSGYAFRERDVSPAVNPLGCLAAVILVVMIVLKFVGVW